MNSVILVRIIKMLFAITNCMLNEIFQVWKSSVVDLESEFQLFFSA